MTGHPLPAAELQEAVGRAERVAAGYSSSALGASYLDLGKAEVAVGYFEREVAVGEAEGERSLAGAGLGYLGLAYSAVGDARRARYQRGPGLAEQFAIEVLPALSTANVRDLLMAVLPVPQLTPESARQLVATYLVNRARSTGSRLRTRQATAILPNLTLPN